MSAAPLSVLLPYTLPSTTPTSVLESKLPFAAVRKSLRLLIDDTADALDELENDISFVYSGYAPISVRLVQCVAQRGGVLSNPADREAKKGDVAIPKVQAHPIVGWKGFEDVLASIPGKTFDIVQSGSSGADTRPVASLRESAEIWIFTSTEYSAVRPAEKPPTTTVVFFLGGCTYTEIAAIRWVGRQNKGEMK